MTYDGLRVMWDRKYSVRVRVSGDKYAKTCGLCGIYNQDDSDDMLLGPTDKKTCTLGKDKVGKPGQPVSLWKA